MKWMVRSFIFVGVGLCVTTALLVEPLTEKLTSLSLLPKSALGAGARGASEKSAKPAHDMVTQMHALNAAELGEAVAQINEEFGVDARPGQFSSHHVARDYLQRLRLARQAEELGFKVDPHAFGDDQFMRRYVEALRQGGETAAQALLDTQAAADPARGPVVRNGRDSIFIHGQKYYRNEHGQYVSADGELLQVSALEPAKRGRMAERQSANSDQNLLPAAGELPYDIDALLDMLNPHPDGDE